MKTVKFKDILWAVAYKTGQDPQQGDFLTNQAVPIGHSISQWVRRLWPSRDWPEWTLTLPFTPSSGHLVSYDYRASDAPETLIKIGRVFAVYLVDPSSVPYPVATDHRLTDFGVHCGFDHGTNVWIKFTPPAPIFTAEVWTADRVYQRDEVAYLDRTGECYRSIFNGNKNHEPVPFVVDDASLHGAPPASEVVQVAQSGQKGSPVQPLVYDIYHIVASDSLETGSSFIKVFDADGVEIANVTHTHILGDTQVSIITELRDALALEPGLASFSITVDTTNLKIRLSDNSQYTVAGQAGWVRASDVSTVDKTVLITPYNAGLSHSAPTRQEVALTFTEDQLVAGATYSVNVTDQNGDVHTFEYTAAANDSMGTVLDGLALAMTAAVVDDDYFENVSVSVDPTSLKLTISTPPASVDADIVLPGQPYWELVQFPLALSDEVIKGAEADLNREWGQTQEAQIADQDVPAETTLKAQQFTNSPSPLTYQQR